MASPVQHCNMALSLLGSEARVMSISPPDGGVESGHCATFYDIARTELLEPGNWAFSLARAPLAQVPNASAAWAYAYAKPSECLRALRVVTPSVAVTVFTQDLIEAHGDDKSSAPFTVEGAVVFTNQPDAVLLYVRDTDDTTKFPASFSSAFAHLLASYLAGPIIKSTEGTRLAGAFRKAALEIANASATASANASSEQDALRPSLLSVRS